MPSEPGLEELHSEMLLLLKEFHKLCKENDIKYSLHAGTLLGAIREKGFIPWDDDIDVALTREEYNKLLETLKRRGKEYRASVQRIRKTPWLIPTWEIEMPIWLDLFIYDYISERKLAQKCKIGPLMLLTAAIHTGRSIGGTHAANYSKIKQVGFYSAYCLGRLFPLEQKLKFYDWFSQNAFCGNKTMIHRSNDQYCSAKIVLPKECMSEYMLATFEDTELMVTKNYHEVLMSSYGEDYMTPTRMDALHLKSHAVTRIGVTDVNEQRRAMMESEDI